MPILSSHPLRTALRKAAPLFCAALLCLSSLPAAELPAQATPASSEPEASSPSGGSAPLLSEANEAFANAGLQEAEHPARAQELYQAAALRYQKLLDSGIQNGKLYYNLGNTWFKLGQTGKAILNYKRALRYIPGDPNLLHNLERARAKRQDNIPPAEETGILHTLLFWHYDLSVSTREIVFATFFVLFWSGLIARRFLRQRSLPSRWMLALCGILCAAFLLSLVVQPLEYAGHRGGVILQAEVIARKGNGDNYQPAFKQPLHEGTEFTVIEERPGWLEVNLADGRRCWLPQEATALVR